MAPETEHPPPVSLANDDGRGYSVALMGASLNTGNRGVSALGASLVKLVWQTRPDATISLLIGNRDATPETVRVDGALKSVGKVNYRLSPRAPFHQQLMCILIMSLLHHALPIPRLRKAIRERSPWVNAVASADFIGDIRGGDSFSDIYGLKRFIMSCLPVMSVIWVRGGIDLFPQTYGPFSSCIARSLARYILSRARSIWCRDRLSLDVVSGLTRNKRSGSLCPDVAFALESSEPESLLAEPPLALGDGEHLVGLNVSGLLYHGGYDRANMFGLKLDYPSFLRNLVERILQMGPFRILLVPHTYAPEGRVESDPAACRAVAGDVDPQFVNRVHVVTGEYDQHELKGIIGRCCFFIGSRMHACIAALSQGIPTVGVAYSRKFSGVFEVLGVENWVVDARAETTSGAVAMVEQLLTERDKNRAFLAPRVAAAKDELDQAFRSILA